MRAVRVHAYGDPAAVRVEDVPDPEPASGEVLVEVDAVGVTLPVVRLVDGSGGGPPLPHVPGGDVVGRVAAVGPGVTGWRIGARVAGLAFTGAYAERAALPAAFLREVPDDVSDEAAVTLVRGGHVALGVLHVSGLRPGESVLVTGAAGGVGHLAVQLARAAGASRVVAAVGNPGKRAFVTALGADAALTYPEVGTGDERFDLVLDGVGGEVQDRCLAALAPLGRLVSFNAAGRPVDVNELRMSGRTVIGFGMAHFASGRADVYDGHRQRLWELCRAGTLRPAVDRTYPLERAADAHRRLAARANLGKVLLRPALDG